MEPRSLVLGTWSPRSQWPTQMRAPVVWCLGNTQDR